jgi:hypothetical protein
MKKRPMIVCFTLKKATTWGILNKLMYTQVHFLIKMLFHDSNFQKYHSKINKILVRPNGIVKIRGEGEMWTQSTRLANLNCAKWTYEGESNTRNGSSVIYVDINETE